MVNGIYHVSTVPRTADQPHLELATSSVLLDERQVAELLHIKSCTVRNERIRGKLAYTRVGRRIFYSREQIGEYLKRQSVRAWGVYQTEIQSQARSETTGLAKSQDAKERRARGVERGTTSVADRHAVSALAQQIFKRPASRSRTGSS
jgi:hypothetical protein